MALGPLWFNIDFVHMYKLFRLHSYTVLKKGEQESTKHYAVQQLSSMS